MNKVVITGSTGFVGSSLVKYLLKKKFKVAVIVRENSNLYNLKEILDDLKVFKYDNDLENLISFFNEYNPKLVFHLASNFKAEHEFNQVDSLVQSNISFGLHILEAMKETGVKHLINTGTSWQHYNNEDYNPVCLYAATKQAFESLIEYYVQAEGFRAITLKLFDTYGENDKRPKLINLLNKFADEKKELNMSLGNQPLNLVHINDVCNAFFIAGEELNQKDFIGHKKYAVSNEKYYKIKEVISLYEDVSGDKIDIIWGGRAYRKREVMVLWNKGKKLQKWTAKISLEEGLKRLYNHRKLNEFNQ